MKKFIKILITQLVVIVLLTSQSFAFKLPFVGDKKSGVVTEDSEKEKRKKEEKEQKAKQKEEEKKKKKEQKEKAVAEKQKNKKYLIVDTTITYSAGRGR